MRKHGHGVSRTAQELRAERLSTSPTGLSVKVSPLPQTLGGLFRLIGRCGPVLPWNRQHSAQPKVIADEVLAVAFVSNEFNERIELPLIPLLLLVKALLIR